MYNSFTGAAHVCQCGGQYGHGYVYPATASPVVLSVVDIERIADAVVRKLDERDKAAYTQRGDILVETQWCIECQQLKDTAGHEYGCKVGRKEYGHD